MNIGRKLFLAFAVTVLAGISVGGLGLWNLNVVKHLADRVYQENVLAQESLIQATQDYLNMRLMIRDFLLTQDKGRVGEFRQKSQDLGTSFLGHIADFRKAVGGDQSDSQASQLAKFQDSFQAYQTVVEAVFSQAESGDFRGALQTMTGDGGARAQAMRTEMDALVAQIQIASQKLNRDGALAVASAFQATVVLLIVAILFSLGAALFLARNLAGPMVRASALARRLADGDLTVQIASADLSRKDETGTLARSLDTLAQRLTQFVQALKETGTEIHRSAKDLDNRASGTAMAAARISGTVQAFQERTLSQVASVTESTATVTQIASTIERFDRLIEEQSASVTQTSAALEQMASNIRSLSGQAHQLGEAFGGLRTTSDDGRDKLYAMVAKIERIAAQSARLAEANNTIRAIASQTNLLSMNAAIEAAHAGDAGAGFAVVASEIRTLAEQSSMRSKDITQEVKAIQTLIAQAAQDSETAKLAFGAVLAKIDALGRFEGELTNALAEQDEGAKQILDATARTSSVTADVRQGSTEILSGSQAIRGEMDSLLGLSRQMEVSLGEVTRDSQAIGMASAGVLEDAAKNRELAVRLEEVVGEFRLP